MSAIVILAGGKSKRMGRDKLELDLDGRTLLESVVSRFTGEFEDVYLSVADAAKYPDVTISRIVDLIPGAGPLSGLHAALRTLSGDGVFLVAADLPNACPLAAKRLIELSEGHEACIVKLPDGRLEPLFGFYSRRLLPRCEDALKSGDFRMTVLFDGPNIRYVEPHELGQLWDESLIMNINYPEDYEKLQK